MSLSPLDLLARVSAATAPSNARPEGVSLQFEPSELARRLPASVNLQIADEVVDVVGATASLADLPDGRYEARLLAEDLEVDVVEPVTIAGGAGRVMLGRVTRETFRIRLVSEDNGAKAPIAGPVRFLTLDGLGEEYVDTRATADADGQVTVRLQPDLPYRVEVDGETGAAPHPSFNASDALETIDDGAERSVLARRYSVVLEGGLDLAGQLVVARRPPDDAGQSQQEVDATFGPEGLAFLDLGAGTWQLGYESGLLEPPTLTRSSGIQRLAVQRPATVAPIEAPTLVIRLETPANAPLAGNLSVSGPRGLIGCAPAEPEAAMVLPFGGRFEVALNGHPTLDALAQVEVNPGEVAEVTLRATFGSRRLWRFAVPGVEQLAVLGQDGVLELAEPVDAMPVPDLGPARAILTFGGASAALTPRTATTDDASFVYATDATVTIPEPLAVVYPDDWIHECGAGVVRLRSGPAIAYTRRGDYFFQTRVDIADGRPLDLSSATRVDPTALPRVP